MNHQERAEKIIETHVFILRRPGEADSDVTLRDHLKSAIAAEMAKAVEEAFKSDEALGKCSALITNIACEKSAKKARIEAYADAVKIAESLSPGVHTGYNCEKCSSFCCDCELCSCHPANGQIATAIRARAKELK